MKDVEHKGLNFWLQFDGVLQEQKSSINLNENIKTVGSQLNWKTEEAWYECSNFGVFIKNRFGACGIQAAALAAINIATMHNLKLFACHWAAQSRGSM